MPKLVLMSVAKSIVAYCRLKCVLRGSFKGIESITWWVGFSAGVTHWTTEIVAIELQMLGKKGDGASDRRLEPPLENDGPAGGTRDSRDLSDDGPSTYEADDDLPF